LFFLRADPERDFAPPDLEELRLLAPDFAVVLLGFLVVAFFLKLGSTLFFVVFRAIYAPESIL
jgi:hypothetical protein